MKRPQQRARLRLVAGAALTLTTAGLVLVPVGSALAENAGDQAFSGTVRNYSAYVGAEILNTINARANIGESVAVADSTGLNKPGYAGTGTGDFAVPGTITADPTARSYGRSAVLGIGFTGLNVQPLKAESHSTTVLDGALESVSTPLGDLDIPLLGHISAFTGVADTNWNDAVLSGGGRLAYSDSNIATVELLNGISGFPLPGSLFPLASAELGQNTSEVKLIGDATACTEGLAVRSEATWDFADVHFLGGFIDVSWGGDAGNPGDSAIMAATANGLPGGARVDVPELGDMTVRVGDASLELQPGASIEIDKILQDAGGILGSTLATFVGGEISYEGVTDLTESADGTHAHGALNGLEANLSLLGIPIVAPNGLGSVEIGVMRGEVDAIAPAGGLNCTVTGTDPTATDVTTDPTATDVTTDPTATDVTTDPLGTDVTTDPTATDVTTDPTGTDVTTDPTATDVTTDPTATDVTTDPTATDPTATDVTTDPTATDVTTDPTATDPTATDVTTDPLGTDVTTDPTATDVTTDPTATDPTATDVTTDPTATDPTATDVTTDPTATDPLGTDVTTDPTATDPLGTDVTTDPQGTDVTTDPQGTDVTTDPQGTDVTTDADAGTDVVPPGSTNADASAAADASASTDVQGPGGLPDTGGVPVQLLALALGLVLVGGRLLGASRYWQNQAR